VRYDAASRALLITGGTQERRVDTDGRHAVAVGRGSSARSSAPPSVKASNGEAYTVVAGTLHRVAADGMVADRYHLESFGIGDASALALAPTGDTTDAPEALSLFVADASSDSVVELAAEVSLAAAAVNETATLANVIDTTTGSWGTHFSSDPSGITYWPAAGKLIVDDGEVEEPTNDWTYPGADVYESTLDGTQTRAWDATGFTHEPVGAAFDAVNGILYLSEDSNTKIFEINPMNGIFGDGDDVRRTWDTDALYGAGDPEGIAYGGGSLWIVDGMNGEVYRVQTGADAKFGTADDAYNHFDIGGFGFNDAEGIEYNNGTLLVASTKPDKGIIELTTGGALLRNIALPGGIDPHKPSGLALAPASPGHGTGTHLYVTDRGVDNTGQDPGQPTPNDGKIYELAIGSTPPSPSATPAPSATPRPSSTPKPSATATPAASATPKPSATATPAPSNPFTDIDDSIFKNDIIWLAGQNITHGCTATTYCPNSRVLRDQMASFLVRALHLGTTTVDFFDDDNGNLHESNINRLAAAGLTSGCGFRQYCPRDPVNRDQMASFLSRAFHLAASNTNFFNDDNGNQHENQINALAASGITGGCAPGKYCPSTAVTRGQMAAFLHRAILR
jgi:hypothetical protein